MTNCAFETPFADFHIHTRFSRDSLLTEERFIEKAVGYAEERGRAAEVGFASGACLAVPRAEWERAGGFAGDFFLYHEDVELSLRLRLAGGRIGIERAATVDHEYEFEKGPAKWRHVERNRWATIVRTYPAALLGIWQLRHSVEPSTS
jgi:GT2 family glycosyltransferase